MSDETKTQAEETTATVRRPSWTVRANLLRQETTVWIGHSVEFFDDEAEAVLCYERHRRAGDTPTKRPFHQADERDLHILDTRRQPPPPPSRDGVVRVHILSEGRPLCGFSDQMPNFWPAGHRWVGKYGKHLATCQECRERAQ